MFSFFTRKSLFRNALLFAFYLVTAVAHAQVPTNGLVAYYPFNGNANDESGNGNNPTTNNATVTTDRFGNANKAYNFNGIDNWISFTTPPMTVIDNWTISAWVNPATLSQFSMAVNVGFDNGTGAPSCGYGFGMSNGGSGAVNGNILIGKFGDVAWFNSGMSYNAPNTWYHIVLSRASGITKYYMNGIQSSTTSSGTPLPPTKFTIGGEDGNGSGFRFWNGKIDDIAIYNRALSTTEVTQLYNAEAPPVTLQTGLVAYYPFNGNANDESGNGNTPTSNNATLTIDRFGNANRAYSFNGINNKIVIPDANSLDLSATGTISLWIKQFGANLDQINNAYAGRIIDKGSPGVDDGYLIDEIHSVSQQSSSYCSGDNGRIRFIGGGGFSADECFQYQIWHHIVVTFDNGTAKYYMNGILKKTSQLSSTIPVNNLPLVLGYTTRDGYSSYYYNGLLDDIRIYNRAISTAEVTQLYNSYTPSVPPVPIQLASRLFKVENTNTYKVFLMWQTTDLATSYEIYRDNQWIGQTTTTIFGDVRGAGTYNYQVVAVNQQGRSAKTDISTVVVPASNQSPIQYGKFCVYVRTTDNNPIENALITFTDGSTLQTQQNGTAIIEALPYNTTKVVSSITKAGWVFAPAANSSYTITINQSISFIRVKATSAATNSNTDPTYIPPYEADLLVFDEPNIVYPSFTKGQNYELKVQLRSNSIDNWYGNIRLVAVLKGGASIDDQPPTFYIGSILNKTLSSRGEEVIFKPKGGKLVADAGIYDLYIQAQPIINYSSNFHNINIDPATNPTVTYGQNFVKPITVAVAPNTNFFTHQDIIEDVSDDIAEGLDRWGYFGDLVGVVKNVSNKNSMIGKIADKLKVYVESIDLTVEPVEAINSKIQFFKELNAIRAGTDPQKRYFKVVKFITEKVAVGNPYAKIISGYLEVGESMVDAIDRISDELNDAIVGPTIRDRSINIKVQKEKKWWRSTSYFTNVEVIRYLTKAELVGTNRFGGPLRPVTLGISEDSNDNTVLNLNPSNFFQDEGSKIYLQLTFSNNRSLVVPIRSDFVKYDGNAGPIIFVLGTNASQPTQIPDLFKIIAPNEF